MDLRNPDWVMGQNLKERKHQNGAYKQTDGK
jgi:hypothetical protein